MSKVIECQRGRLRALNPKEIFIVMLIKDCLVQYGICQVVQNKFSLNIKANTSMFIQTAWHSNGIPERSFEKR